MVFIFSLGVDVFFLFLSIFCPRFPNTLPYFVDSTFVNNRATAFSWKPLMQVFLDELWNQAPELTHHELVLDFFRIRSQDQNDYSDVDQGGFILFL